MKKVFSIVLAAVLCFGLASCSNIREEDGSFSILTSFNPIYTLTLRITYGADNINVQNMAAPSTGCLHDYQLTTADMTKLSHADVFIINGGGMESFMEKAMAANTGLNVLNSSEGIEMLPESGHDHEGGEHEESYNSHIWLSIDKAKKQVENIRDGLIKANAENKEIYEKNTADFLGELDALKDEYNTALAGVGGKVISFHEGLIYLFSDYGIEVTEIIESEPGMSPDPQTLSGIINDVKESGIKVIFTEPQYPTSTAEVIARETGVKISTVDPLVTGDMDKDSYINVMRENLQVILQAMAA